MTEAQKIQSLEYELSNIKAAYKHLSNKVRDMLSIQRAYFKSGKDVQLLRKSKAIEKEVDDIVNPKPVAQGSMDFLAR